MTSRKHPLFVLVLALVGLVACSASRGARSQSTTRTTNADTFNGENGVPAGASTAWTTEGGPASPGVPSTGDVLEQDEVARRDAGARR